MTIHECEECHKKYTCTTDWQYIQFGDEIEGPCGEPYKWGLCSDECAEILSKRRYPDGSCIIGSRRGDNKRLEFLDPIRKKFAQTKDWSLVAKLRDR